MHVTTIDIPHNEGRYVAVVTGPGFNARGGADLYEADGDFRSFATLEEAHAHLASEGVDLTTLTEVVGGFEGSLATDDED